MTRDPVIDPYAPPPPTLWQVVRRAPLTMSLIALCIAVGFWTHLGADLSAVRWLTFVDPFVDPGNRFAFAGLADGQVWRLVTPIVVHFGITHLMFNLLWLYDLGGKIEERLGSARFAVLLGVIAVLSNATQYLVNWDLANGLRFDNALSGGMSGVIYGLFGYAWLRTRGVADPALRPHPQNVALLLAWLVLCMTGLLGHIGNTAHLMGLLTGLAAAFVAERRAPSVPDHHAD